MKVKSIIRKFLILCLIGVICVYSYRIYNKLHEYKKADNIYENLRK